MKQDGKVNEKLRSLLGLYVLQIMVFYPFNFVDEVVLSYHIVCKSLKCIIVMQALFSVSMSYEVSSCIPFVSKLSRFLPFCGLSYAGLITGSDIDAISDNIIRGRPCCFFSKENLYYYYFVFRSSFLVHSLYFRG